MQLDPTLQHQATSEHAADLILGAMTTLMDRLARLEQVFLETISGDGEGLVSRLRRLEEICFGAEAPGALPQRLRKLESITFGEAEVASDTAETAEGSKPSQSDQGLQGSQERSPCSLREALPEAASQQPQQVEDPELWALPAAKRPRHEDRRGFQLVGNAGPAASNPTAFKRFPLREEQLRSLAWMYGQEARSEGLKGGLLADKMGYGKTATTIGLLAEEQQRAQAADCGERPRGYIKNSATLIMCPPHLVQQWEDEFWKFLGEEGVQLCRTAKPKGPYRPALDPITLTADECPFRLVGSGREWIVSEISSELQRQHQSLKPERKLQVGDKIEAMQVRSAPGDLLIGSYRLEGSAPDIHNAYYNPRDMLNRLCLQGRKVKVHVIREKPGRSRTEPVKGIGSLKILTIESTTDVKRLRLGCLCEHFNVVIASTGLLGSMRHLADVRETLEMWQPEDPATGMIMAEKQRALHDCVEKWHDKSLLQAALCSAPVLFEAIWWRRMVLDEFHETESWKMSTREVLKSIGATYRWGLSGTPPLSNTESIMEVAELLNYVRKEASPTMALALENRLSKNLKAEAAQQKLREECQVMIHGFVRQSSSSLAEAIAIREHHEFVEHTAEERLIYRQACHDHFVFDLEVRRAVAFSGMPCTAACKGPALRT